MNAAIHACKFFFRLEPPTSQVSPDELECLLSYAIDAEVIVEIGCFEGKTTASLAHQTPHRVYSVDPFQKGRLGLCYEELIAKAHCRREKLRNVEFIKGFSHTVCAGFQSVIDLLFIDADHSYEAVKKDWLDWFPKVRPGGFVALHDCRLAPSSPAYLGSMKFYEEYLPKIANITEVAGVGSLAVFRVTT